MRKILLATVFFMIAWPTFALDNSNIRYNSEDSAVQFNYPSKWTIEDQLQTFNQRYLYQLWTDSSALTPFLGNADHSRILIELINPITSAFPQNLITPQDYANYVLSKPVNHDSLNHKVFGGFSNSLKDTQDSDNTDSKYNTIIVSPTWFTAEASTSKTITVGGEQGIQVDLMFPDEANRRALLEVVVRKDSWIMVASVSTPLEGLTSGENELNVITKSLMFDAQKAETPFIRNLPSYDFSQISLPQTYVSKDGNLEVHYPTGWRVANDLPYGDPPAGIFVQLEPPQKAVEIYIVVMDVTSDKLGLSPTQNSPEEFMQEERRLAAIDGSQFRIGNHDAVKLVKQKNGESYREFYFALNNYWIASGSITGKDATTVTKHEASVIAVLASLKFTLGEPIIDFDVLHAKLPDTWIHSINTHKDNDYYRFVLRPANRADFSNSYIVIELVNLAVRGYEDVNTPVLKKILAQLVTRVDKSSNVTIGDYTALRAETFTEEGAFFGEYTLGMVNDRWLMVITGMSSTQDWVRDTLPDINTIIEGIEVSLPRDTSK